MPELAICVGSPAKYSAALRNCYSVPTPACEVYNLLVFDQALDLLGSLLSNSSVTVQAPAKLAEVVVAPGIKLALLCQHAHVLITCLDLDQLQPLETILPPGLIAVTPRVREETREVGCLEAAPTPKLTTLCDAHCEVTSSCNLRDVRLVRQFRARGQGSVLLVATTQLSEVVFAPRENASAFGESHGVLFPHANLANALPLKCEHTRWRLTLGITPGV
mmetsp:Transcript_64815/g.104725  ORF Transcript_64815/g.104725 Transcript_64815/m.104725 type:complete len:219 (+) Transcript_64815:561-1217(+)